MGSRIEYTAGHKFGQLTYTGRDESRQYATGRKRMLEVQCSCGKTFWVQHNNLISANTQRCLNCAAKSRANNNKRFEADEVNRRQCIQGYVRGAQKRGLSYELSEAEFVKLTKQNCHYCGAEPSNVFNLKKPDGTPKAAAPFIYNGLDRVDPSKGYSWDNCVPCCYDCNKAKNAMSPERFQAWLHRVYNHYIMEKTSGSLVPSRTILR